MATYPRIFPQRKKLFLNAPWLDGRQPQSGDIRFFEEGGDEIGDMEGFREIRTPGS